MIDEAGSLLSKSESESALEDASTLVRKILTETKAHNPQMELKF